MFWLFMAKKLMEVGGGGGDGPPAPPHATALWAI